MRDSLAPSDSTVDQQCQAAALFEREDDDEATSGDGAGSSEHISDTEEHKEQ